MKDSSTPFLQHQLEMKLSRPFNMQRLAFKTLFLMIHRSPVTICLYCLSVKGELLHLHGTPSGFVKNKFKPRLLTNLLNRSDDEGGYLTISGSHKIRAIFVDSTPLFSKNLFQKF